MQINNCFYFFKEREKNIIDTEKKQKETETNELSKTNFLQLLA